MTDDFECPRCGGLRFYFRSPAPEFCGDCMAMMQSVESVTHERRLRCPHCRHEKPIPDYEGKEYQEGDHDITCDECERDFEFITHIQYRWESPALKSEPKL